MSKNRWFKKLTPQMAWEQYVDSPVEVFISNFYVEGIRDIEAMCQRYARDIPYIFNKQLFTQEQLKRVAELLNEYIVAYVAKKGGIDKLEIYSEEELDAMFDRVLEEVMQNLRQLHDEEKRQWESRKRRRKRKAGRLT
ncbi:MAG: hypothetical protein GX922_04830 [Firmicutes bacterium]|nr:hypothetical protein [Bacillota bacterium]